MKTLTLKHDYQFKDVLHPNGSKTYETHNYGFITIQNPALVNLIEKLLLTGGTGFFYLKYLQEFVDDGRDSYNEIQKAVRILD